MPTFEIDWLEDRSDEGLLAELRRVAALMPGRTLTRDAFESQSKIGASAVERRFGSWNEATRRAGLPGARPDYSDDAILADLRLVSMSHPEEVLTCEFYAAHGGRYSSSLLKRRFGGWFKALDAAGVGHRYVGPDVSDRMRVQPGRAVSDEEILGQIRGLAVRLGKNSLTGREIAAKTENGSLIPARFGSVAEALRRAGLEQGKLGRRYSDDEVYQNLFETWIHYGRPPTCSEMDRSPSKVGSNTYLKRYGGWRKALKAFIEQANSQADRDTAMPTSELGSVVTRAEPADVPVVPANIKSRVPTASPRRSNPRSSSTTDSSVVRDPGIGLRFRVYQRDRFRCRLCGRSTATEPTCVLHVDHVVPFSKGGRTTLDNLQLLCLECNIGKSNREL